jgi:hypothetical protein
VPAARVRALEIVEAAGAHKLAIPREITTWGAEALAF